MLKGEMGIRLVLVVFQNVNNRQLPHCRHVYRFEESSLLRGAIAKKAVNDLSSLLHLRSQRSAGGVRDALPDNSRGAGEMVLRVGQMHGASETLAQPVFPAKDLSHDFPQRSAQRDRIPVAAIAGHDQVGIVARGERPHNARLYSITEMRVTPNH